MVKAVLIIITAVMVSFYFFPFEFAFLPGINTKMIMAGIGLVLVCIQLARKRMPLLDKDFFLLSIIAALVSLIGLFSVAVNDTNDYTYVTYIISMWVWVSAAYVVILMIKSVSGYISVPLVCNYLIAVCVVQCLLAIAIDMWAPLQSAVDRILYGMVFTTEGFLENTDRLYGIGATLDVAGTRFSAVLIMIAYLCVKHGRNINMRLLLWYVIAFIIIAVVGNMIARTTTVGVVLAFIYLMFSLRKFNIKKGVRNNYYIVPIVMFISIVTIIVIYNKNSDFRENIRFAFEGFFSLAEKGRWKVNSNEILKDMYIFPDNIKTWLIGDGYMENPYGDPYYVGPVWHGYYKGTDVGYLRFLFYFGIFGLLTFMYFMYKAARICMTRFSGDLMLFIFIMAVNFIVWLKVSTDIFLVFALFLCISKKDNDAYEERMLHEAQADILPEAEK